MKNLFVVALLAVQILPTLARAESECPVVELNAEGYLASTGHESSGGRRASSAIGIQFATDGERGVDTSSFDAVFNYISTNLKSAKIVKVLNVKWGERGETSICLQYCGSEQAGNGLVDVQRIIRDTRSPLNAKPTTMGVGSCTDLFGKFSGDDRSLEAFEERK